MKKYELIASAKISIVDSYENGVLLMFKVGNGFSALCVQGREVSPLFHGPTERQPYDASREWFSERQDGFLDVETLDLQDDKVQRALRKAQSRLEE